MTEQVEVEKVGNFHFFLSKGPDDSLTFSIFSPVFFSQVVVGCPQNRDFLPFFFFFRISCQQAIHPLPGGVVLNKKPRGAEEENDPLCDAPVCNIAKVGLLQVME